MFYLCLQYSLLAQYEDDEISLSNLVIIKDRGMFLLKFYCKAIRRL